MVAIGFPALAAVIFGMMIQSTQSLFGAVGTPLIVGVQSGLDKTNLIESLSQKGLEWDSFFKVIVSEVAIIHAICGTFMPIFLVLIMTRFFGKNKSWTEGLSIFPFTIFASLSFTIPYLITGIFLGPEFPSILGGLFGLFIVTIAVKKRFLIPQDSWNFLPKSNWPKSWLGNINISANDHKKKKISTILAWLPYILLAILLVLSRTIETFRTFLQSINISFSNILNEEKINASLQILYFQGGF